MIVICVVFCLVASALGHRDVLYALEHGRIIGGTAVNILDYPYQVSFQLINANVQTHIHACGGSIIGRKWILTAAHCTDAVKQLPPNVPKVDMWVRAGSSKYASGGVHIKVKNYFQHPNYSNITKDNDVSILELEKELTYGPGIRNIPLVPKGTPIPVGAAAKVAGWGKTETLDTSPILLGVTVTVVQQTVCYQAYISNGFSITNNMLCAGDTKGGHDTCQGDSGGPLVVNGIQIGITAFGEVCGSAKYPGVYMRVANYRDYIYKICGI